MGRVRCMKMTSAAYAALQNKDGEVLYFVNDAGSFSPESLETNGKVYLGDKLLANVQDMTFSSGLKMYYNGSDVTSSSSLGTIMVNASGHWYGSQGAYDDLSDNNQLQAGVVYHVQVNPDWNESNPNHLGYIKNKPNIMNMTVTGTTASFYYI